jgi:hypothetical protein
MNPDDDCVTTFTCSSSEIEIEAAAAAATSRNKKILYTHTRGKYWYVTVHRNRHPPLIVANNKSTLWQLCPPVVIWLPLIFLLILHHSQ